MSSPKTSWIGHFSRTPVAHRSPGPLASRAVKSVFQLIGAAATAIVGLAKVIDLVAGTSILSTWADAVFMFGGVCFVLSAASQVYFRWFTKIGKKASLTKKIKDTAGSLLAAGAGGMFAAVTLIRHDEEQTTAALVVYLLGAPLLLALVTPIAWHVHKATRKVECPLCREKIHREATRCKHCHGSFFRVTVKPNAR
jgi:hypothetical protein